MGTAHPLAHTRVTPKSMSPPTQKTIWAKFIYCGKETRTITKAFKNSKFKVSYSIKNTLKNY
jgi:hypothetical protein